MWKYLSEPLAHCWSTSDAPIAAGIDLDGVDRAFVRRALGVCAQDFLTRVDRRDLGASVPSVLGVQTVRQQDDGILVGIVRSILGRRVERCHANAERQPAPGEIDSLIGVTGGLQVAD